MVRYPFSEDMDACRPVIEKMSKRQRFEMLKDVIQNMAERGDVEEIVYFVCEQLQGDSAKVVESYAEEAKRPPAPSAKRRKA